ncbi:MAG: penicillinase repressor [SAR86 cluster bacterium]|uniref:Penicillinase repressor n=1 Tax=SAR86 cluster bacterium TaxID=2030880 RepID=A0A2A5AHM0_9GAMM|nr:MAG: penicillinase repressor [SAR86 cluster bacterium]
MSKSKVLSKTPLSRGEREVMEVIWDLGEVGVLPVTEVLNQRRPVARNTVRTLMERMKEKGWLTYRTQGRSYLYTATVPREESLGQRVMDMVDKACGGNPEKLMMALLQYRGLSEDETKRIRKMLDDAKKQQSIK